jgi:hypothetical protein
MYYLRDKATLGELSLCNTLDEFEGFVEGFICPIPKEDGDWLFRVAMKGQGRSWCIYHPMYLAVRSLGGPSYHQRGVLDPIPLDTIGGSHE